MLSLLAAAQKMSPLEKLQNVSGQFWLMLILAFLALAVIIFLFKQLAGANKIILVIVLCVASGIVGFNWIYNRTEPAALTPIVDILAQWFPSKGAYETKQQQDPSKPGVHKNTPAPKPSSSGK